VSVRQQGEEYATGTEAVADNARVIVETAELVASWRKN
jgi:hypothetical protein